MRAGAVLLIAGVLLRLDHVAVQDALAIANSSLDAAHRQFHADYHFPVNQPPVDFVSIVSPFRRVVLSAETSARGGRRMFGQREALAALHPDSDRFEVYVELTFHPHNTLIGIPAYAVLLEPVRSPGPPIVPSQIEPLPRYGPRVNEPWHPYTYPLVAPRAPGGALRGGTLIARFDAARIDGTAAYAVAIREGGKEIARVIADLGRLR